METAAGSRKILVAIKRVVDANVRMDETGRPDMNDWRGRGADALVAGSVTRLADGRFDVRAKLWDVVRGKELELLEMPRDVLSGFRNYIGSVAANAATGTVAVTSPEGNSLAVLDAASGRVVATRSLVEIC